MLLAEKNGYISIIEDVVTTEAYIEFQYAMESGRYKKYVKERGLKWELFEDVTKASEWILGKEAV